VNFVSFSFYCYFYCKPLVIVCVNGHFYDWLNEQWTAHLPKSVLVNVLSSAHLPHQLCKKYSVRKITLLQTPSQGRENSHCTWCVAGWVSRPFRGSSEVAACRRDQVDTECTAERHEQRVPCASRPAQFYESRQKVEWPSDSVVVRCRLLAATEDTTDDCEPTAQLL